MLQIYCGDGKGKTTAAVGLLIRMAGRKKKSIFFQFMKDGSSGEISVLKSIPGLTIVNGKETVKFTFRMTEKEKEEDRNFYEEKLAMISEMEADLYVLDEAVNAVRTGLLSEESLLEFIRKNEAAEIVLTGRGASEKLLERADYVTEMKKIKHPFDEGVLSRKGIEY